jgi:hypothetical protein
MKHFPYYQRIWWDALCDLRHQHAADCRSSQPDKLRFQTGRLFRALMRRIKATSRDKVRTIRRCYSFMTDQSLSLGYEEPRRLHLEEMEALFNSRAAAAPKSTRSRAPLKLQLQSIASWIEAQESLSMWLEFRDWRDYWQADDADKADQAAQAFMLSQLRKYQIPIQFRGKRLLGANRKGVPWDRLRWAKIQKRAARSTEKKSTNCSQTEQWVWWCYPVFSRYGWSAREVRDSAIKRGLREGIHQSVSHFRRYWITRGLRFTGKKTNRNNPPLDEFVRHMAIPSLDSADGTVIWFPPAANSLRK